MTTRKPLPGWVTTHIENYLKTNGEDGHIWRGVTTLLLTTTGRRSGEPLLLPLIYGEDNGRYIIVASKGGAADHPAWYKNLVAEPNVQVQVKGDKFNATARTANSEEKPALWKLMSGIFPPYIEYQQKTAREIPVVILERA